jgi:cytochrome c-type biogenesis protein
MNEGAATLALGAGLVAAVNPCGFALLPAYLSLLVLDDQPSRTVAVARAVKATTAMTAGFAGVFAAFGLVISPVAAAVTEYLPGFTVVFGLLLLGAGGWVLTGRRLRTTSASASARRRGRRPLTRSAWSMAGFGASYAVASLGCTIAPFLAVVVTAFRSGGVIDGIVLFLAYAAGMGLVVGVAAVAVALAQHRLLQQIRRTGRVLPRVGAVLLMVAGGYVAWYGAWELRVLHAGAGADPVVSAAAIIQQWSADKIAAVGASGFLAVLAILLTAGLVTRRRRPPQRRPSQRATGQPHPEERR